MPHDDHPQSLELLIILQEEEDLETKLQDAKGTIGEIRNQIEDLNQQVQTLSKSLFEHLSGFNMGITLSKELGNLIVKDMECKKLKEDTT